MDSLQKANHWQVIRVKPRHEKKVAAYLLKAGIEYYLPMFRTKRVWSDRLKWVDLPLMSPYLFVRIPDRERSKVFISQSILSYVFYNGEIAIVKDSEINQIRALCESNSAICFASHWNLNDRCIIDFGALKDIEGMVIQKLNDRLILNIKGLGSIYSLEVPMNLVRKIS